MKRLAFVLLLLPALSWAQKPTVIISGDGSATVVSVGTQGPPGANIPAAGTEGQGLCKSGAGLGWCQTFVCTGGVCSFSVPMLQSAADNCANPPFSFAGDPTSGLCSSAVGTVNLRTAGANRLECSGTLCTVAVPMTLGDQTLRFTQPNAGDRYLLDVSFPFDSLAGNFRLKMTDHPNPYGPRINHVANFGFNMDKAKADEPGWGISMESRYDTLVTQSYSEFHVVYFAPNPSSTSYRLWSGSVNEFNERANQYFQSSIFEWRGPDSLVYEHLDIDAKFHYLERGMQFLADTNFFVHILHNKAACGYVSLFNLNAADEFVVGAPVRLADTLICPTCTATSTRASTALGGSSSSTGYYSTALGFEAAATRNGQVAHASFAQGDTPGTNQYSRILVVGGTTSAAEAELKIGSTWRIDLEAGRYYTVTVTSITQWYEATANDTIISHRATFAASRSGAASTVRINGATSDFSLTEVYSNLATTNVVVRPDTTNGSINVILIPPAANTKSLYTTAVVEWVEMKWGL